MSGPSFYRSDPSPACKKCGYPGHLTYQCRNFVQLDPAKEVVLDVSSTSSESDLDYATPLTDLRSLELKEKLAKPKKKKKKKSEKSKKKEKEKKKRKRRRSSSSSSDDESSSSDSERKKRKRKKKSSKKKKKSSRKREKSESSD